MKILKEISRTSKISIDGLSFLVEQNKVQCKCRSKTWSKCKYGLHYDFPKKDFVFGSYFDWIIKNQCSIYCPKHYNCNLSIISKIPLLKEITKPKSNSVCISRNENITCELWLCNNFPLPARSIFTLLDVISNNNPLLKKFNEFINISSSSTAFPVKTIFPISSSAKAQIEFSLITLKLYYT